tara:strand:+ start:416 stop:691 length:276 start_codon:yes stop_codon:yes gene_type:complete
MEDFTSTDDVNYDRSLHTLYRMGFESARLDDTTGRTRVRDNRSDDWQLCYMDERRESRTKENGEGREMMKYLKRLWCALLNKKCHDKCDCV